MNTEASGTAVWTPWPRQEEAMTEESITITGEGLEVTHDPPIEPEHPDDPSEDESEPSTGAPSDPVED